MKFYDLDKKKYECEDLNNVHFRPGTYAFVLNANDELLMIIDEKSGQWELPGGGLDIGEEIFESVVREVKEETGYDVKVKNEHPIAVEKEMAYYISDKKYVHGINFFFECELKSERQGSQNFDETENILEVSWVSKEDFLKKDIVYFQENIIRKYINEIWK